MGKRQVDEGDLQMAVLSGPIGPAAELHARERMRCFFFYCWSVKLTCDYLARAHGIALKPQDVIKVSATHQTGRGCRVGGSKFDAKTPLATNTQAQPRATGYAAMDAAHANNLGLLDRLKLPLRQLALTDPGADQLEQHVLGSCSGTRPLPQSMNLGPDAVIDDVHRLLIGVVFPVGGANTGPVVTTHFASMYLNEASIRLAKYQQQKRGTEPAFADLVDYYLQGIAARQPVIVRDARCGVSPLCDELNVRLAALRAGAPRLRVDDYVEP